MFPSTLSGFPFVVGKRGYSVPNIFCHGYAVLVLPWPCGTTTVELWQKIQWNTCYQMASLAFRFHKITFRLGLHPDLAGGAYNATPDLSRLGRRIPQLVEWHSGRTSVFGRWPAADGWPLMMVNRPLPVSQLGQLSLSSFRSRQISSKL